MTETTYTVVGMTCDHCVLSVREEVSEVAGVDRRRRRPRSGPPARARRGRLRRRRRAPPSPRPATRSPRERRRPPRRRSSPSLVLAVRRRGARGRRDRAPRRRPRRPATTTRADHIAGDADDDDPRWPPTAGRIPSAAWPSPRTACASSSSSPSCAAAATETLRFRIVDDARRDGARLRRRARRSACT